jgi:hypothetical protein
MDHTSTMYVRHVSKVPTILTDISQGIQEKLLNSPLLKSLNPLHREAWIRMEFKAKDHLSGQLRIYILPDDIGRSSIDRYKSPQRKALQALLGQLDVSSNTWNGEWLEESPIIHLGSALNREDGEDASLFQIFNTLPSPNPEPSTVTDPYSREAMEALLEGDVEGLITKMHPYQRRSAATMLQREAQPSQIIDPRLTPLLDQNGNTWYCNFESSTCLREPRTYEAAKGGICAETMGLGKTLICLGLILATKDISSQIPAEYSVDTLPVRKKTGSLINIAAANIGRNGTPWKRHFEELSEEGLDYSKCIEAIKRNPGYYFLPAPIPRRSSRNPIELPPRKIYLTTATLVVVPSNLVKQWEQEIKKHTIGLKVLIMKKPKAKEPLPPAEELATYDIILFSKQRFDKEAQDGSDAMGRRRSTVSGVCNCQYIGATRHRDCTCFREEDAYHSSLKDLHFKRIITDEGHGFGNASRTSKTEAVTVIELLQLTSRWIISGTPTRGLYGAEVSMANSEEPSTINTPESLDKIETPLRNFTGDFTEEFAGLLDSAGSKTLHQREIAFYKEERKDLEKLGNIATIYLKARPWANTFADGDMASWSQHVLQPRHGSKSHGNMDCLKSTLEGMIIRHRPEDVEKDVTLPPMKHRIVTLEGSLQDKLSLNMFSMMIVSNAITSERRDADYLFHPRQRKALNQLVMNLRQASFHWSGFTLEDVKVTIDIANTFLDKKEVLVSTEDETLLREAIRIGEIVLASGTKKAIARWHEMPMYIQNELPEDVRAAWALDGESTNPTLLGTTMVHAAQKFVSKQLWKDDPMEGLVDAGKSSLESADLVANPSSTRKPISKRKDSKSKRADQSAPTLAGGVHISPDKTPNKRHVNDPSRSVNMDGSQGSPVKPPRKIPSTKRQSFMSVNDPQSAPEEDLDQIDEAPLNITKLKSAMKKPQKGDSREIRPLDPNSPLASAAIISTSSVKLSYLIDRITDYQETEKILVFYEAENVAYYIAQALECLNIKHLIYAKTLPSEKKAQYVVTFNQSDSFRVLLMDISQAAFGLDMSSASRVFFVNPVFSPQVEAQAVKRAHRIGQTKPVFVETLVLQGSIEEVILARRKNMTNEEHTKCKNILDDHEMYDWIRNVNFIPIPSEGVPPPEQMAKLESPQLMFGRGFVSNVEGVHDPNADLIMDGFSPKSKGKGKKTAFKEEQNDEDEDESSSISSTSGKTNYTTSTKRNRYGFSSLLGAVVQFADQDDDNNDDDAESVGSASSAKRRRIAGLLSGISG